MKATPLLAIPLALLALSLPACHRHEGEAHEEHHKVVVTTPKVKDVVITDDGFEATVRVRGVKERVVATAEGTTITPIK